MTPESGTPNCIANGGMLIENLRLELVWVLFHLFFFKHFHQFSAQTSGGLHCHIDNEEVGLLIKILM